MNMFLDFKVKRWARTDALVWIFFSDWKEIRTDRDFFSLIRERVDDQIMKKTISSRDLDQDDEKFVQSTIEKLTKLSPALSTTVNAAPLLWIRFAFTALRNSISPTEFFLKQYTRWRFTRSLDYPGETIIKLNGAAKTSNRPRTFIVENKEFHGTPLDEFFLRKTFPADIDCKSEWGFSSSRSKKEINPAKNKRQEDVGTFALQIISACICDAAEHQKISGLKNNKILGRYESTIRREDLANALMLKFKHKIKYAQSTVIKAISETVTCPGRGRKTGLY